MSRKTAERHSEDFRPFLRGSDLRAGDLVYLDPPHLISSGEYNKICNEDNERNLLSLLDEPVRLGPYRPTTKSTSAKEMNANANTTSMRRDSTTGF